MERYQRCQITATRVGSAQLTFFVRCLQCRLHLHSIPLPAVRESHIRAEEFGVFFRCCLAEISRNSGKEQKLPKQRSVQWFYGDLRVRGSQTQPSAYKDHTTCRFSCGLEGSGLNSHKLIHEIPNAGSSDRIASTAISAWFFTRWLGDVHSRRYRQLDRQNMIRRPNSI